MRFQSLFLCVGGKMWMAEGRIAPCTVEIPQYALKGQKLLAQGIALGNYERKPVAL